MFFFSYFVFLNCYKYSPFFIRLLFSSLIRYTFFLMVFFPSSCCLITKSLSVSLFLMSLTDCWFFFPEKISPGSVMFRAGFLTGLKYPRNYGISFVWLGAYLHPSVVMFLWKYICYPVWIEWENRQPGMKTGGTRMKRGGKYSCVILWFGNQYLFVFLSYTSI